MLHENLVIRKSKHVIILIDTPIQHKTEHKTCRSFSMKVTENTAEKLCPKVWVSSGLWEPPDLPGEGSLFRETGDKVRQSLEGGCQGP